MSVLIIDLARVLDESAEGMSAAKALAKRWEEAKSEHALLVARAEKLKGDKQDTARRDLLAFERNSLSTIEKERKELRQSLLEKVRPLVAKLAKERGADAVVEASAALFVAEKADITSEVLALLVS